MSAKDNLKVIHTIDGAMLENSYGKATIVRKEVGLLKLQTGEIVIADPTRRFALEDFDRKTLTRRAPSGLHPFEIYVAESARDRRVAFAEIRFRDSQPVKYIEAKTIFDVEKKRRGPCGYVVNDSITGFMDAEVFRTICSLPRFSVLDKTIDFDLYETDEEYEEMLHCVVGSSEDGELTAAQIHINSGVYYWYWGVDGRGELCCLTADFFTHD